MLLWLFPIFPPSIDFKNIFRFFFFPEISVIVSDYIVRFQRRQWQPTPILLPEDSQGWGSLVGCHLWGRTESDTTEVIQQQQQHIVRFRGRPLPPPPARVTSKVEKLESGQEVMEEGCPESGHVLLVLVVDTSVIVSQISDRQMFPVKVQIVSLSDFAGSLVSVITIQLHHSFTKATLNRK